MRNENFKPLLLIFVFLLLASIYHDTRVHWHHYHVVIFLFYNKTSKNTSLQFMERQLCSLFLVCMGFDPIFIIFCWPIFTIIHQCTSICDPLKNINQPSQHTETNVHNHYFFLVSAMVLYSSTSMTWLIYLVMFDNLDLLTPLADTPLQVSPTCTRYYYLHSA